MMVFYYIILRFEKCLKKLKAKEKPLKVKLKSSTCCCGDPFAPSLNVNSNHVFFRLPSTAGGFFLIKFRSK